MPIRSLYIRFLQQLVGVLLPTIEHRRFLQVALAKLEILFANTVFLQTDCKQNCKRDGYNYLCTNTVVSDILFADFRF